MGTRIWADFETYSEVDIKKHGGMAYARHDSTNPICLAWAIDDGPVNLWTPDKPDPVELLDEIKKGTLFYAHKLQFDFRIWNYILVRDFGWPALSLDQCVDTQALAATYGLPLALKDAGSAMNITHAKYADQGKNLIKLLCKPNKKGGQPHPGDPVYRARFAEFYEYAKQDVRAMREFVMNGLPREHLIPKEHEIWKMTYEMNTHGLPIAYEDAKAITAVLNEYIAREMVKVGEYTNGEVQSVTQTVKLVAWVRANGYHIPDLTAQTVEESLDDPSCPPHIRRVLALRQELGKSSVAKFQKLLDLAVKEDDGHYYVHDNLEFHGAGPGRWAARGFQMHNLPRAKVDNPEAHIAKFIAIANGDTKEVTIEDPVGVAKALIRPMIKAHDDDIILVKDYSSIENKILHCLAEDWETVEDFKAGVDQYKTMASERYRVTYDEVTKPQRQMGKVIILGSGFGMGWETFIETAKNQFGMVVSEEEAKLAIKAYRGKYTKVVDLWRNLKTAAATCVITGKKQTVGYITFGLAKVKNRLWLAMLLPSGKCVYYCDPRVEQRYIPGYEHMGKVPTVTHLGRHPKTGKWTRNALIPGRITENAVQGTAREAMAQGMLNVRERMPHVRLIGTVHDEGIALIKRKYFTETTLEEFSHNLCDIHWAKGWPITADGYAATRYKKD